MFSIKWTRRLAIIVAALALTLSVGVVDALLYVLLGSKDPLHLSVAVPTGLTLYLATCLYGPFLFGDYLEQQRNVNLNARASLVVPLLGISGAGLLVAGSYLLQKPTATIPFLWLGVLLFGLGLAFLASTMRCVRPKRS